LTGAVLAALIMGFVLAGCGSTPAAPDLTGVTSYYVRANGNDKNAGTSEAAPFKTLAKAVEAAAKTPVKKITVIGTLAGNTIIKDTDKTAKIPTKSFQSVVVNGISIVRADLPGVAEIDWSVDEKDPDEILITGKPDASGAERAVLTPAKHNTAILIIGISTVRLEHIEISGLKSTEELSGVLIGNGVLTLARGAKITNNRDGGLYANNSVVIMREDAEVSNNEGANLVGVSLANGSLLVMRDTSRVTGNKTTDGAGGGVALNGASLLMQDNAEISGNSAAKGAGAGIFARADTKSGFVSRITMSGKSLVSGNKAEFAGSGVTVVGSTLLMQDDAAITGNRAGQNGGGVLAFNDGENRGQITMSGNAAVRDNTTAEAGGGIAVGGAAVTMSDNAAVSGNSAALSGGGIIVSNDEGQLGEVTMSGSAAVRGNTSQAGGGGILLQGILDLNDKAAITGNTAAAGGGVWGAGDDSGVRWDKGKALTDYITGNTAPEYPDTNFTGK
jgi:hypothetical protein